MVDHHHRHSCGKELSGRYCRPGTKHEKDRERERAKHIHPPICCSIAMVEMINYTFPTSTASLFHVVNNFFRHATRIEFPVARGGRRRQENEPTKL